MVPIDYKTVIGDRIPSCFSRYIKKYPFAFNEKELFQLVVVAWIKCGERENWLSQLFLLVDHIPLPRVLFNGNNDRDHYEAINEIFCLVNEDRSSLTQYFDAVFGRVGKRPYELDGIQFYRDRFEIKLSHF